MSKLIIQPHGRLNDWVADEKGYFHDLGLDYEINLSAAERNSQTAAALKGAAAIPDIVSGAFERYKEGRGRKGDDAGDVSCACHWTVNQAAKVNDGVMWGKAYSVCEAAIVVPSDSPVARPEDLAGVEVAVGYHSGSHLLRYSSARGIPVTERHQTQIRRNCLVARRFCARHENTGSQRLRTPALPA